MNSARMGVLISLVLTLVACGGGGSSSAPPAPAPANVAPVAAAGPAQSVQLGTGVTLDGSGSSDANGDVLAYSWSLSARPPGSNAALAASTSAHPTLMPDVGGNYLASLTVNDGKVNSTAATVTITVTLATDPNFRIAGGGASTIAAGSATSLAVPAAGLPQGVTLGFAWTLVSKPAGSATVLASADAAQAGLTPDLPGSYVASLVVSDGKRLSVPVMTTINAMDAAAFRGFVDIANIGTCNDFASDLYLIDGRYVFAYVAGNCPEESYGAGLYGLTPAQFLCGVHDSFGGGQRNCPDASVGPLFDTAFAHRSQSDLGLGASHQVSKFIKPAPVPGGASAVPFAVIDQGYSSYQSGANAIVRNGTDWAALWLAHKGSPGTPALPNVDFSKKIVLAIFYSQTSTCIDTHVTSVYVLAQQLVVEYATVPSSAPGAACAAIAFNAGELIAIDIPADPNLHIVFQRKPAFF